MLLARAAALPEEPMLFERDGADWRWRAFRSAASDLCRWRQRCLAFGAAESVSYTARATADALFAGLALADSVARVVPLAPEQGDADLPAVDRHLPVGGAVGAECASPQTVRRVAGRWSLEAGRGRRVEVASEELAASARALAERLPPPDRGRDVIVFGRPFDRLREQLTLGWAIASGAAIVFESEPLGLPLTVLWARPTVIHGSVAELEELAATWAAAGRKRRRAIDKGLARLRALLVDGEDRRLPEPWRRPGVVVMRLAADGPAPAGR